MRSPARVTDNHRLRRLCYVDVNVRQTRRPLKSAKRKKRKLKSREAECDTIFILPKQLKTVPRAFSQPESQGFHSLAFFLYNGPLTVRCFSVFRVSRLLWTERHCQHCTFLISLNDKKIFLTII